MAAEMLLEDNASEPGELTSGESSKLIKLSITLMSGECVATLTVADTMLVAALKECIARDEGTPERQQKLLLSGDFEELRDSRSIGSYGPFTEEDPPSSTVLLVRTAAFFPSETFAGHRPGYHLTLGKDGLGYYRDDHDERSQAVDAFDGCWHWHCANGERDTFIIQQGFLYLGKRGCTKHLPLRKINATKFSIKESGSAELISETELLWNDVTWLDSVRNHDRKTWTREGPA
ncbi:unnamed protein product [Polarella glacialis]|uniref:Ubiquitin-like domain-containing protein n=2 Tax=Polarella glacialis TaxID=89957 RepID=A0A813LT78_POLGL|nr:unnamed protein product [Polarella glacialis]